MFKEVPSQFDFPNMEQETLAFWDTEKIYERSLKEREGGKPFVFFEGPPTANGLPHPGHCLTRAIKDLFPRFKTMTGHYCLRKGGWDTHGLPVEVEVCKELGIHSKEEIEKYGVEPFNRKCLESVFRYTKEWEQLTRRLGFWVNLDEAYVTYHQSYIESVWWSLKQLFDAGLLYQGHKIVWWWAQGGTALSSGEVGQGYREVDDPSVYVRFPLVDDERTRKFIADCGLQIADSNQSRDRKGAPGQLALLVWTTTPWTLPSNMFAAVHKDFDYAVVRDEETGERLVFAAALVESIAKKIKKMDKWKIERTVKGSALLDLRYTPPFDCYTRAPHEIGTRYQGPGTTWWEFQLKDADGTTKDVLWRVLHAQFVTLESGTGLVHEAPAFGEVDFALLAEEQAKFPSIANYAKLFCPVNPNGKFSDQGPEYCRGRWVKDCDKDIIRDLKERGLLLHQEQYRHDYPFCWRAEEDPLIQYPRKSWFIRTTQFKDAMLENNQRINWMPEHIKDGRFGKFLESNVDWSLSRERYWGTPLPIWVCQGEACGHLEATESYDELVGKPGIDGLGIWESAKKQSPGLSEHLRVHKPYIDAITYDCPKCKAARMKRVTEVIDCWYDSGAMPFAQWGFPHKNAEMFQKQFPADFISEALDQTRGWFYSLVAISTMLFGAKNPAQGRPSSATHIPQLPYPLPFRNCIVLGLLMGEDGLKMSKSKKNYKEPSYIFDKEGADAMRWLFFSGQAPWTSIRFQESAIAEAQREFLIRLYNCYSFFVIYANIDQWTPAPASDHQSRDRKGAPESCSELDRWILSELAQCSVSVFDRLEAYDNYLAAKALSAFVDALSNWYVRRSRDRFWKSGMDADKSSAYATLHECLVTLSKLIAPFTPFFAEAMYQNLVRTHDAASPISVHLCDYPVMAATRDAVGKGVDASLNTRIDTVRDLVSCGRAARSQAKLRVRQPLSCAEIVPTQASDAAWIGGDYSSLIMEELNVKSVAFAANPEEYVEYRLKPNFRVIGPKFGALGPAIKVTLGNEKDPARLLRELQTGGEASITVNGQKVALTSEDIQIELVAKPGWAASQCPAGVVVLKTEITPELRDEGLARDLVNQIQQVRKNLNLRYEQRIDLAIVGNEELGRVVNAFATTIQSETLATSLLTTPLRDTQPVDVEVEGHSAQIYVHPQ